MVILFICSHEMSKFVVFFSGVNEQTALENLICPATNKILGRILTARPCKMMGKEDFLLSK